MSGTHDTQIPCTIDKQVLVNDAAIFLRKHACCSHRMPGRTRKFVRDSRHSKQQMRIPN